MALIAIRCRSRSGDFYDPRMGALAPEPISADERLVRAHARELVALAAEH